MIDKVYGFRVRVSDLLRENANLKRENQRLKEIIAEKVVDYE